MLRKLAILILMALSFTAVAGMANNVATLAEIDASAVPVFHATVYGDGWADIVNGKLICVGEHYNAPLVEMHCSEALTLSDRIRMSQAEPQL